MKRLIFAFLVLFLLVAVPHIEADNVATETICDVDIGGASIDYTSQAVLLHNSNPRLPLGEVEVPREQGHTSPCVGQTHEDVFLYHLIYGCLQLDGLKVNFPITDEIPGEGDSSKTLEGNLKRASKKWVM